MIAPSWHDANLRAIAEKVRRAARLNRADGRALLATDELTALGRLAEMARHRLHGRRAFYINNRHINYTNICVLRCKFCSFARRPGEAGGYTLSVEQILQQADQARREGASELHIVGGLHPNLKLDYYLQICRRIKQNHPHVHLKAFTAVEIAHIAKVSRTSSEQVLRRLHAAGLDSLPGGGAELFAERVRRQAAPSKPPPSRWLDIHHQAHQLGMCTTATMLFGHIETHEEILDHLLALRNAQDRALRGGRGKFTAFVPLPLRPAGTAWSHLPGPDATQCLKIFAVSRLMLDNFEHIKAFWPLLGRELAEVALAFGADDVDGTVRQYKIAGERADSCRADSLQEMIHNAGLKPVQRDSLYKPMDTATGLREARAADKLTNLTSKQ